MHKLVFLTENKISSVQRRRREVVSNLKTRSETPDGKHPTRTHSCHFFTDWVLTWPSGILAADITRRPVVLNVRSEPKISPLRPCQMEAPHATRQWRTLVVLVRGSEADFTASLLWRPTRQKGPVIYISRECHRARGSGRLRASSNAASPSIISPPSGEPRAMFVVTSLND